MFLFHGLGGFPVCGIVIGQRSETMLCHLQSQIFRKQVSLSFFFFPLFSFPSLSAFTPPTTLCGLILKVLNPPLVAFGGCQMMFYSYFVLHFNLSCLSDHMHPSLLFVCRARADRMTASPCLSLRGHEMKRLYSIFTNTPWQLLLLSLMFL